MNVLDILALVIIGVSALMSFRVGLIREVFALGALLIGLLGAIVLGRAFGHTIPDLLGSPVATQVVFFIACFLAVYLLVSLIGSLVARVFRAMHLSSLDHLLGFLFGAVRGAILTFLVISLLAVLLPSSHRLLTESRAYALSERPRQVFAELLPEAARDALKKRPSLEEILPEKKNDQKSKRPGERVGIPL